MKEINELNRRIVGLMKDKMPEDDWYTHPTAEAEVIPRHRST